MKMEHIKVLRIGLDQLDILQKISCQTCIETFTLGNKDSSMQKYLNDSFNPNKLTNELNNPDSEFYFAYFDDNVIGYLKVNRGEAQTELQDIKALELERIYVINDFQRKKIGQKLLDKALEIANSNNAEYIWLGVWENNLKAVNFYKKNGFVKFSEHAFMFGDDKQTDIMMKLEIRRDAQFGRLYKGFDGKMMMIE